MIKKHQKVKPYRFVWALKNQLPGKRIFHRL